MFSKKLQKVITPEYYKIYYFQCISITKFSCLTEIIFVMYF